MVANQTDVSSNFWQLRSASHMKFIEKCLMCMEKHIFVKNVYKWTKHGFATIRLRQKVSWSGNILALW